MPSKLVDEILVPAEYGRAGKVSSGQRMRVIAIDGPQVSDMAVSPTTIKRPIFPTSPICGIAISGPEMAIGLGISIRARPGAT